ncbi:MAG TPA: macro domain-containing protein [Chloroflexota bacterium]|nr:macro domain-containing protein [Chloroflexota bacterium]
MAQIGPASIEVVQGDLVEMDVDAIVNAANSGLQAGGGVCGAIFRAAGPADLQRACDAVGPCPTGEARITPGFKLKAQHVIHAVGPIWRGGGQGEPDQLAGAYRSSLELAREHGLASIAFPAISTGIYGYPFEPATQVAVRTTAEVLRQDAGSLRRVVFVVRDAAAEATYNGALAALSKL